MEEKNLRQDGQFEKYPYSFELRINDNIVCQRYFKINGFKERSLESYELKKALEKCATYIKNDLRSKSNLYYDYTAPQIFKDIHEMNEWEWWNARRNYTMDYIARELGVDNLTEDDRKYTFEIEPFSYVILEDDEQVFFWTGSEMEPYNKYFNRVEYLPGNVNGSELPCTLKLSFLVNDVEVCSTVWDGNDYPRFIRNNIDLSNSRNKYKTPDNYSPFEATMVDIMNAEHRDLIPVIVKEFCVTCSDSKKFTTHLVYGDKKYVNQQSDKLSNILSGLRNKEE